MGGEVPEGVQLPTPAPSPDQETVLALEPREELREVLAVGIQRSG